MVPTLGGNHASWGPGFWSQQSSPWISRRRTASGPPGLPAVPAFQPSHFALFEVHMKVTRREFFNYCAGSAAALGLAGTLGPLEKALAATTGPPIIWIKGASCTGCTVSLANRISSSAPVDLADLLIHTIDLVYHPTLMGAAGDLAVQTLANAAAGSYILAVEGGIPTIFSGKTCTIYTYNGVDVTALAPVQQLAPKAAKVLSIGTWESFGGMAAANP